MGFAEFARRHGDYAMVGLAASAQADGKGLGDVRLAYFGVGNVPLRAKKAETALTEGNIDEAVKALDADLDPSGRRAGDRRDQKASRRRAAAARRQAAHGGAAMSEQRCDITLTVNGETVIETVDARKTLVDFLRDDLVLTGSHVGCEHGVCGACTVRVDGVIVRGCLMLAAQCDGAKVETIEGVSDAGEIADLQDGVRAAQRAAMRLLHARHAADRAGAAGATAACRAARKSASRFPATTAAAPATTPSSMRSSRSRRRAREASDENRRRLPVRSSPRSTGRTPTSAARCRGPTSRG